MVYNQDLTNMVGNYLYGAAKAKTAGYLRGTRSKNKTVSKGYKHWNDARNREEYYKLRPFIARQILNKKETKNTKFLVNYNGVVNTMGKLQNFCIGVDIPIDKGSSIANRQGNKILLSGIRMDIGLVDNRNGFNLDSIPRIHKFFIIEAMNDGGTPAANFFKKYGSADPESFDSVTNNDHHLLTQRAINTDQYKILKSWTFETFGVATNASPAKSQIYKTLYCNLKNRPFEFFATASPTQTQQVIPKIWLCWYSFEPDVNGAANRAYTDMEQHMEAAIYFKD